MWSQMPWITDHSSSRMRSLSWTVSSSPPNSIHQYAQPLSPALMMRRCGMEVRVMSLAKSGGTNLTGWPAVLRIEEEGGAQGDVVGRLRSPRLVVLGARLAADAVVGARQVADETVARAVEEEGALETYPPLRPHHPAGHRSDPPRLVRAFRVDLTHVGVEVERDAGLGAHGVQDHGVPVVGVSVRVAELVLHEQFAHDAALTGMVVLAVPGRAAHPDPDLAARVAAEHRPVVDQRDAPAEPGRGDRRADPGQAAADDGDVVPCGFVPHVVRHYFQSGLAASP